MHACEPASAPGFVVLCIARQTAECSLSWARKAKHILPCNFSKFSQRVAGMLPTCNGCRWILFRICKIHRSWAGFARSLTIDINSKITDVVWLFVLMCYLYPLVRSKRQDFPWALHVCSIWKWTKPIHCSAIFKNKLSSGAVAEGNAIFHFSAPHDSPSPSCLWFRYLWKNY